MDRITLIHRIILYSELVRRIDENTVLGHFIIEALSNIVDEYLNICPRSRQLFDHDPNSVICVL